MYYLPLLIQNRRYHYCKLFPDTSNETDVPYQFVIGRETGSQVKLFKLTQQTRFLSRRKLGADLTYDPRKVSLGASFYEDTLTLTFFVRKQEGEKQNFEEIKDLLNSEGLSLEYRDDELNLTYHGSDDSRSFWIIIQLRDGADQLFEGYFQVHIGLASGIYDAVFDFGSEASQLAVRKRSNAFEKTNRIDMLRRMLRNFYLPAKQEGRLTEGQHDPSLPFSNPDSDSYRSRFTAHTDEYNGKGKSLFQSNFFVKRFYHCNGKNSAPFSMDDLIIQAPFEEGDHEWVSISGDLIDGPRYINNKGEDRYEMVSNLKLAELEITRNFPICIHDVEADITNKEIQDEVFRRLMSQFLHLLLAELENTLRPQPHKLLKLTLLVPNIYAQQRVNDLVKNVYTDLQRIIETYKYNYRGFEVQTLSESDAAFLGLMSNASIPELKGHTLKKNGHYLIIDSGKGTTDVSLISKGKDNRLGSLFRDGFAGAGNAISYAFFQTLGIRVCGDLKRDRERLTEFVLGQPIGDKYIFFKKLEQLKKLYNKGEGQDIPYSLEAFLELDFRFDEDRLEYFRDDIETHFLRQKIPLDDYFGIIDHTINQIADQVVKLVEQTGVEHFDKVILSGRNFLMDEFREKVSAKLNGRFQVNDFLFAEKELKKSCLYGPLARPEGTNFNSDLIGTPVIVNQAGRMSTLISKLRGHKPRLEKRKVTNLHYEDFFLDGIDIGPEDRITICGRELNIPPLDSDIINVIYVGDGFLARTETECVKLDFARASGQEVDTDPLAWMSLFPYVDGPVMLSPTLIPESELTFTVSEPEPVPGPGPETMPTQESEPYVEPEPVITPEVSQPPAGKSPLPNSGPAESSPGLPVSPDPNDDMWDYI